MADDFPTLTVTAQSGSFTGHDSGWLLTLEDPLSGMSLLHLRFTPQQMGDLMCGRRTAGDVELHALVAGQNVGKRQEVMRMNVDWLADDDEWITDDEGQNVDHHLRFWLRKEHRDLVDAGWEPDRLAGDGTGGSGFNRHRKSPEGYEIILRRFVDVEAS